MLDVAVIGDGVIGLSTAFELGRLGAATHVFGAARKGTASEAAAGLLAPSMGALPEAMRPFFAMSLQAYPPLVARLRRFDPDLVIVQGLIEATDSEPSSGLAGGGARRLTAAELAILEPSLLARGGALFHPGDGAIDNERLLHALRIAVDAFPSVTRSMDEVEGVEVDGSHATVITNAGARVDARRIVLAAGAWAPGIRGLPRHLPVVPLKGQMLALRSTTLRHPISGADVYLVPRQSETIVGATTENAGFDVTVDPADIERLRSAAIALCPSLADAAVIRTWAGIRPATPDMFPVLGPDPDAPRLIYACGHSKNGILLAAATGVTTAEAAVGAPSDPRLGPYSIERFERSSTTRRDNR